MPTMRDVIAEAPCAIKSISGFAGRHAAGGSTRSSPGTRSSLVSTRHQRRRRAARTMLHLGRRADGTGIAQLELDESAEARPDTDDSVDATRFGHPRGVIPPSEGHGVEGEPADRDLAAKVIGVGPDLPDVVDAHVTDEEIRPRISGAARLERGKLERELAREN